MVNRIRLSGWAYLQTGNQCVLAAYGAALWPSIERPASDYFRAYANHFGLVVAGRTLDEVYDDDFHPRAATSPGGAFGVVHCLHFGSSEGVFSEARARASLTFFPDGAAAWSSIERALIDTGSLAAIFINDNPGSRFARMHAVMLGFDTGFYAYDSNHGLVDLPGGKSELGHLGHAFVVSSPCAA